MRKFYPGTGLIISAFMALLSYVMRVNRDDMNANALTLSTAFIHTFLSWLLIQFILHYKYPAGFARKGILAIAGCMVLSLLPFTITSQFTAVQDRVLALPRGYRAVYFLLLLRGAAMGGFLYFIAYLLHNASLSQQSQLENERLKKENLQARLSLLQEQVSPHFLFNSLGTLQSMVAEKAPREFIQRLAEVYRYLLGTRMSQLVTVKAELDFTSAYLHILQERFEAALITDINIPETKMQMMLPPASLQLLIENAVKHNIATEETPLKIEITAEAGNFLIVRNSLRKKKAVSNSPGSGLGNIRERYRLLSGQDIIISETGGYFTVQIPLLS